MTGPSVLFIGGTGVISHASVELAARRGYEVTVLNRGESALRPAPQGVEVLHADVRDILSVGEALGRREFDVVAEFMAFTPEHVQRDIDFFAGRAGQYVFISSASTYQKPPARLPITESTPLRNPFSQYARDKIASERVLTDAYRDSGFPATIVRPSHTYDSTSLPIIGDWTTIDRMLRGEPIVLHGDGSSLWVLTHSRDFATGFVGLLGLPAAVGDTLQITSDEVLSWDTITRIMADAAGVTPHIVHVTSDRLATLDHALGESLLGDRTHSVIFDNAKVKRLVPDFSASTTWAQGAREIMDWRRGHPDQNVVDPKLNDFFDRLVAEAAQP